MTNYKHKAIYDLYSTVKSIYEDNGVFTAKDQDGNEVSIDMSAVNTKVSELQAEADARVQAKADLKASAKAKLMSGEALTEDEANTIVL